MLGQLLAEEQPSHLAVAMDRPEPTFRHESFAAYKANRPPMADDLAVQLPVLRQALDALCIAMVDYPGAEADDIIGTLAAVGAQQGCTVRIVTGDRDALQLVGPRVSVLLTRRGTGDLDVVDPGAVKERYGVTPSELIEIKALMGDTSDHIPGVPGVGEKTASRLIAQFGTVEHLLQRLGEVTPPRVREAVRASLEQLRLNLRLVRIVTDLPLGVGLPDLVRRPPDEAAAARLFAELGFHALLERFRVPEAEPARESVFAVAHSAVAPAFVRVSSVEAEDDLRRRAHEGVPTGLAIGLDAKGELCGLAWADPVGASAPRVWMAGADTPPQVSVGRHVCTADSKTLCRVVRRSGQPWQGVGFDATLAAYLLDPGRTRYPLEDSLQRFGLDATEWQDSATALAAEARAVGRLADLVHSELLHRGLSRVYQEIELPLVEVLVAMEDAGICMDGPELKRLGADYAVRIAALQAEIFQLAGGPFNINSTPQLRQLLFDRLGLQPSKRTKTGYSTDAGVLEELASVHPLPERILAFRALQKLLSTYIQGLEPQIGPDSRIHTTFQQTVTATGRLSSQDPNLQNIPVREEIGKPLRRAFVAPPGSVLVAADYSQVELRILAHFSADDGLIAAFASGADIHRATAAEVWSVSPSDVTAAQRSAAKAVNFGIVYGISDFGLARQLRCPVAEAHDIITRYFARYPGVKRYMESVVETARRDGEVRTLFGRLRPLPEIRSGNRTARALAERTAMNTPIQGTAADLIKLAMIVAFRRLVEASRMARLVLQIHDELIVETPVEERDAVLALTKESMEEVGAMHGLRVPLRADVASGPNWLDMV